MEPYADSEQFGIEGFAGFLQRLEAANSPLHPKTLADLLEKSAISEDDISRWINFDSSIYTRNSAGCFSHAEVLVMCWRSGQLTPIHNHKGSACAIKVIRGAATEIAYKQSNCGTLVPISHDRFYQGDIMSSFDDDIHQMGNLERARTDLITVHVYSPPLSQMKLFDKNTTFFDDYDSLLDKVSKRLK